MSFWKKLFGITETPARAPVKTDNRPQAAVPKPPSEAALAWIQAGGLVGGVGVESRVPPSLKSKEACKRLVDDAIAEFDALHPGRRLEEPVEFEYITAPKDGESDLIKADVSLKYKSMADYRSSFDAQKAFFDVFEKRGLPYKG